MERSIDSISKSARGDLNVGILGEIEAQRGVDTFLYQDEKIQYVGLSVSSGPVIETDTTKSSIGSDTISFITDRAVILIIGEFDSDAEWLKSTDFDPRLFKPEHGEFFIFDESIKIPHHKIQTVESSSALIRSVDKIKIHTGDGFRINFSEYEIEDFGEFGKDQTISAPTVRFRLWASGHSGVSVGDIASYIDERTKKQKKNIEILRNKYNELQSEKMDIMFTNSDIASQLDSEQLEIPKPSSFESITECENKYNELEQTIKEWKSIESFYPELNNKANQLDSEQLEIPKPSSFESAKECEEKYSELEQAIEEWGSAEKDYAELNKIQSKVERKVAESSAVEIWVENLPEVPPPEEFDTPTDATNEYNSIRIELESIEHIISQSFEVEDWISRYTPKNVSAGAESTAIQKIHQDIIRCIGNHRDLSEVESELKLINDIFSLSSNLTDKVDNLPIDPTQKLIDSIQHDGMPESEELHEWYELIQKVEKTSTFMQETDLSHPSIDADHWEESLEMAVEEQYVNVLSPIVDQVEKMESGMWELDDLYQISWQEFESLIGTLYESFGYETEVTSDTADMGIDVWATNSDERVAIQAKRYQEGNTVGRETLQKLASTLAKGDADRVIVVTTSEFARTAKEYSESFGSEIELIDGEELRDQLNNSDIPPIQ